MSNVTIKWADSIDAPWLRMEPLRIGETPPGLGTPEKYALLSDGEKPLLRVDAYSSSEQSFAFFDAIIWHEFLVIGWGDSVYLTNIESGSVTEHILNSYFGHLYAHDEFLLVASCERLFRIDRDGSLNWRSERLGIDGIVVGDVTNSMITGDGEWDPPGGWRPFRVRLDSGQRIT